MGLFNHNDVNYVGPDFEFRQKLNHRSDSKNLVLILNTPMWVSDIVMSCQKNLCRGIRTFYIGINRYQVLGNDTTRVYGTTENCSLDLIHLLSTQVKEQGFDVTKSGQFDHDLGRYFNFVQPLTWIYGHDVTN
jgi:hypothetical protein